MKKLDPNAGSNSKLPKEVQDLVKMIFDVDQMKKTMLEFEVRFSTSCEYFATNFVTMRGSPANAVLN